MIRPEAKQAILDFREVIFGVAALTLGTHWVMNGYAYQPFIGFVLGIAGGIALWLGYRKVRFPRGEGGVGVVEVTERQITYLTAQGGAALAIDGLSRVEIRTATGGITWVFTANSGESLHIPGNAPGSEGLLDALVSLPGVNYDEASRAARRASAQGARPDAYLIWQSDKRALH